MGKTAQHRHSLFKKIITPLLLVMLLQSVIFYYATVLSGVTETLKRNAEDVLFERVNTQCNTLESMFTTQWSNFSVASSGIQRVYEELSAWGNEVYTSAEQQRSMLEGSVPTLISMLRSNAVTGVFLILNDGKDYVERAPGEEQSKYGVCIRDYDPASEYTAMEDLMLVRCPAALTRTVGCSMEAWWEALFTFSDRTPGDYYYQPLRLAYENPGADADDLTYFSGVHNFGSSDRNVVSYSMPLMDKNGYPFGVLGVELTVDYLKTLLPVATLYGANDGCYALVQHTDGATEFSVIATNGVLFQQSYGTQKTFSAQWIGNNMLECSGTLTETSLRGSVSNLQIYNHNTPFESQKLSLIGLVKTDRLYALNALVESRIGMVTMGVMLLGFLTVLFICRKLTKPINRLSERVRSADGTEGKRLERLNIDEIDDLVESIESLNDKISRTQIRTEFFSRMSHDMRTPMNAIIGFSSPELLETADEAQLRDYLKKINSSGGYLLALINDVLDMTKIEAQRMELRMEPLTTDDILDDVFPMIEEVANAKQVRVVMDCPPSNAVFFGDRQRMSQILMNLLSNAVKFTPEGGTVRLAAKELTRTDATVSYEIIIQDNGCGMSEDFQKKMYEPFAQAVSVGGGTGLGLAITKQLITLMGGTIDCTSAPGGGTRFVIRLTARLTENQEEHQLHREAESTEDAAAGLEGRRVLLCEDHPLNAQIARRLLERRGMLVDEASNGKLGVERFSQSPEGYYDAILMDIRMPEMDGLDASRAIRTLPRTDADVPIIAMTANAFKEDVEATRMAGMNAHLSKPIDPKILYVTLEEYLGEHKK